MGALGAGRRGQRAAGLHRRLAAPGDGLPRSRGTNVRWVWCPNANTGNLPFMQFYPGDRWVDWVGLDGFNWGGSIGWRSFSEIFAGSYEELAARTSKPIVIAETGSGQTDGDKAAWVTSALLRELPISRGCARSSGTTPSIASTSASPAPLRRCGVPRRASPCPATGPGRAQLLATPPRLSGRVAPIPMPSGGYGKPSLLEELWRKLGDRLGGGAVAADRPAGGRPARPRPVAVRRRSVRAGA